MLDLIKRLVAPGRPHYRGASSPVIAAPIAPGTARPYVLWANDYDPPVPRRPCPNCGGGAPKPQVLTVRYTTPEQPLRFARLLHCPDCTCHFYERQKLPDYAESAMLERGRVPYYLQQGAGISLITAPLVRVGKPPGSRYLDVGCGFGFGPDFAARALGWQAQGIDPGAIAALGRDMLGVDIALRYLRDDEPELSSACDVVMASEVIEHVKSPINFARALRQVLRPGGILILTTPDGADLRPGTAAGALVGLLAPGWHLIFQNRDSLRTLLLRAGFSDVVVDKDGYSLVAYASDRPFHLRTDQAALHAAYVGYLGRRAADFPSGHDLLLGFAGRALQEAANDGDHEAAERSYRMLRDACRLRFGIDLDAITEIPSEAATCPLERMVEIMPLSLGCLLYADAMRRLAKGEARPPLEHRLLCAADAADALRRALSELAQEDALSEEIAWTARAEAVLCAAVAGSPDIIERVHALPPFPGGGDHRIPPVDERALVALVNAGHHALGAAFAEAAGLQQAAWANPANGDEQALLDELRRDVLFCLAILDLQETEPDTSGRAVWRFARVRRQLVASGQQEAQSGLFWAAVQGEMQALERLGFADRVPGLLAAAQAEGGAPADDAAATATRIAEAAAVPDHLVTLVNAKRYEEARLLADILGNDEPPDLLPGTMRDRDRDRVFSLAVLDVQPGGDPARAVRRFAFVRASLWEPRGGTLANPPLFWAALRGEIEAVTMVDGQRAAEALRRQALQEIGDRVEEIPEDLRLSRPNGDGFPA